MQSKYVVAIVSSVGAVGLFALDSIGTPTLCGGTEFTRCMRETHNALMAFIPLLPLAILSWVYIKVDQKIYSSWLKFAIPWTIGSMVAIFLAPQYSSDFLLPIEKGSVAFVSGILFVVISIAIMVISRPKKR